MTRSTFSGFTIAQLAMTASQRALDVTGQNIANINTEGYTRQQLDLVSLNLHGGERMATGPGSKIGFGVEITGISQIRDPFLDVQYRNQIAKVGTADAQQGTLDRLANIFDETQKDSIKTTLSSLLSKLNKLSSDSHVNDDTFDTMVRSTCETIVNFIHQKSFDLRNVREETISGLEKTDIPNVNSLLSDIGQLNDAIWESQILGNPALELKDKRNSKLDELASYLPINVTYKDVKIGSGATFEYPVVTFKGSDGMTYNLTAGEHGENYASLSVERNLGSDGKEDGTVSISLVPAGRLPSDSSSALKTDITNYLKDGSLKGIVDSLNKSGELDDPSTEFRGIGYYEKYFDSFVQSFAKTFNDLNLDTSPFTGAGKIPTSGTAKPLTSTGIEPAEFSLNFLSSSGNFLSGEKIVIAGNYYTFGDGSPGTVAIGSDLNDSLTNLANAMNPDTFNVSGTPMAGKWNYNSATGKLTWLSDNPVPNGVTVASDGIKTGGSNITLSYQANSSNIKNNNLFTTSDGSSTFTAANIKLADSWLNNNIHLISTTKTDAGTTANDNILKVKNYLKQKRDFRYEYTYTDALGNPQKGSISFFNGDYLDCYANLETRQGIDSSSTKKILNNNIAVLKQTANSRDSVSGVSLDEEGINLMKFQKSFSAAARLMTTLDEALDVLINKTGIVGR